MTARRYAVGIAEVWFRVLPALTEASYDVKKRLSFGRTPHALRTVDWSASNR